jgi:hypothetical protein
MVRLAVLAAATSLLAGCMDYDGPPEDTRTFDLTDFDSIEASSGVVIVLEQGPYAVEARSWGADLSGLTLESEGAVLKASANRKMVIGFPPRYEVTVTAPALASVAASSGANVNGGSLHLTSFKAAASSGASINLDGDCQTAEFDAEAGASINAEGLKCRSTGASASSGARINAYASDETDASAFAGGSVSISGSPSNVKKNASAGGSVKVN